MAKFNLFARARTAQGAPGYVRSLKFDLFLLAVTNLVGEHTAYETADVRDERYVELIRRNTLADPEWTARLLGWLRSSANLRSASLVGAAEFVSARLAAGQNGLSRQVVASVLQRADEPGELLAYWLAQHGRNVPKPIKRGIADAVRRLYHERSLLKWDSSARAFRFGDVLELTHPKPVDERQGALFRHAIDRRHDRDGELSAELTLLRARADLAAVPVEERRARLDPDVLARAGMTWEAVAGWLQGPLDAAAWEALIPSMGYMACLRNLRNFDEAGVSDEVAAVVAARLADPAEVARSRQLPMRFLSAYRAAPSLRWALALEKAITASLANVPALSGRTLVLVDTSGSMNTQLNRHSELKRWDAAVVFGLALAQRCAEADVVSFSNDTKVFPARKGESLLRAVDRWRADGFMFGQGTWTERAVRKHFKGHDRVVIVTDEQAHGGSVHKSVPADVPLYTWDLAGYRVGHTPSEVPFRYTFGGLSDGAFGLVELVEAGEQGLWPW